MKVKKASHFSRGEFLIQLDELRKKDLEALQADQRKNRQRVLERQIGRSGVPVRFRERSFDNYRCEVKEQHTALNAAKVYAENFAMILANGTSMLFVGNPGTGKTHLATAILITIIRRGYTGLFMSAYEAVMSVFDSYGGAGNTLGEIKRLVSPDLLVIDEFGEQSGKQGETRVLFEILNQRYANMRPTIILSNEDYSSIESLLRPKGIDRLKEAGGAVVWFDWASMRRQIKYNKDRVA